VTDDWSFFTNHGLVLLALAREPDLRLRDVAEVVGITERATQDLVNELVEEGYLERARVGRRNRYLVHGETLLRHRLTRERAASDLIRAMLTELRVAPDRTACDGVVLACSDHRFIEPLRQFLASQGLLGRAEVVLWPGGGAALSGPVRSQLLTVLADRTAELRPERVILIAHWDCSAEGIFRRSRTEVSRTARALNRSRQQAMARVRRRLGTTPELWFMDRRRTRMITLRPAAPTDAGAPGRA
jgi:DNA-binding MarR family transcriptional regulator